MALTDNYVVGYHLNESSGNATDVLSSNDLTAINSPGATTGKLSGARTTSSTGGSLFNHASNSTFQTGDIDFTLAGWVNPTSNSLSAASTVVCKGDISNGTEYYLQTGTVSAAQLTFTFGSGTVTASTFGNLTASTWYFVVAWHDSINNVLGISVNDSANTVSYSAGTSTSVGQFRMGALGFFGDNSNVQFWDGSLDEFGFWKRVLTSGERTTLYNSGTGLAYPFSVATVHPWWLYATQQVIGGPG